MPLILRLPQPADEEPAKYQLLINHPIATDDALLVAQPVPNAVTRQKGAAALTDLSQRR